MNIGATKKITLQFPVGTDLNAALKVVCYIVINKIVVLRYKKGGGTGYDGDITIDGTDANVCFVNIARAESLRLTKGRMSCEALWNMTNSDFGSAGEFNIVWPDIDYVQHSNTTNE